MSATQKFASLDPDGFAKGGGLFDDVNLEYVGAKFTQEAPEGYDTDGSLIFFATEIQIEGVDDAVIQSYSLGEKTSAKFTIAEGGLGLIPVDDTSNISAQSKFALYIQALKAAGFPINTLFGDAGVAGLIGLKAHVNRMPDPERKGLKLNKQQQERREKYGPESTLVVTKIIALPGQVAKGGAVKGSSTTAAVAQVAAAVDGDSSLSDTAAITLLEILSENDNKIQRSKLPVLVAKKHMKHAQRQELSNLVFSEEFLKTQNGWSYDPASKPQVVTA